ncbi:BMP family ABC transporter substrate-binding protein [Thalassobacillus devorans]|uniref:BMP family ABC transporter substrate-binding protein n=1 Tax=Thalassobacillus devorans TaxID=279813 RepID=UPI00049031BF|nr:BMP family ABC transporter substrate-binding protein [Thalassobacillus devorans]
MKKTIVLNLLAIMLLTGCNVGFSEGEVRSVGMLVETTIHDQAWGQKGYKGLLKIKEEYDVDVYFKEGIKNQSDVNKAVDELVNKGVNVIFGHSSIYGEYFKSIHEDFPEVHFVYFNGGYSAENVTSLNFSADAMGFFGGVVAGSMTKSNQVGLIAAHEWQPEVEGFYEGVKYINPEAKVNFSFVGGWDDTERAMKLYDRMAKQGTDVFYPAGDGFNPPMIQQIQNDGHYAIGYVSDQSSLGKGTVLTSTVQHVEKLYKIAMERLMKGNLPGEVLTFDFQDGAISMGKFSPNVPEEVKDQVNNMVDNYVETGELPTEK